MSRLSFPKRGLYAITDSELCADGLTDAVSTVLQGGAAVIQYRDKSTNSDRRRKQANELLELCHAHDVPLIINDDWLLAADIGADGVHLGRDDGTVSEARGVLDPSAFIGVSCYASVQRALDAQAAGASYVAFGSFFPSSTKPQATPVDLELIRRHRTELEIPVVGIGGITADNGAELVDAGIDLLAVISAVFGAADRRAAARSFVELF